MEEEVETFLVVMSVGLELDFPRDGVRLPLTQRLEDALLKFLHFPTRVELVGLEKPEDLGDLSIVPESQFQLQNLVRWAKKEQHQHFFQEFEAGQS